MIHKCSFFCGERRRLDVTILHLPKSSEKIIIHVHCFRDMRWLGVQDTLDGLLHADNTYSQNMFRVRKVILGGLLCRPWRTNRLKTSTLRGMSIGPGTPNSGSAKRSPDRCWIYFRTGLLQCPCDVPQCLMFLLFTIHVDHMHEMDISTLVFDVSAFCEAFLTICTLNMLLLLYTLYLYSMSNT